MNNFNDIITSKKAFLAPMAGFSDIAMRAICLKYGAVAAVTELVSSNALSFNDKKSLDIMAILPKEEVANEAVFCGFDFMPCGIQIFGGDCYNMAKAAAKASEFNPTFIDINMGCPAPKVVKSGGGSALLANPDLAIKITKAVVQEAKNIPVTVKIRKGFDENNLTGVEVAKRSESVGAKAIFMHGRLRGQAYSSDVDIDYIKKVKESVKIPVVANGNICDKNSALEMLLYTKADSLMIGRASLGNPFIFGQINQMIDKISSENINIDEIDYDDKIKLNSIKAKILDKECENNESTDIVKILEIMRIHAQMLVLVHGERQGSLLARSNLVQYLKGFKGAANARKLLTQASSLEDLLSVINLIKSSL